MATALQMLARYPTLLRFAPCIHAFTPQNLFTRIMNTGSKQKKGDPDVQVCFADFPHCASFFRRVRTSARFFPKKECCVRLDVGEWAVALNSCEALGSLKANLASKKSLGRTPSCFVFQAAFVCIMGQPENGVGGLVAKWRIKQTLLVTKMLASRRRSIVGLFSGCLCLQDKAA